MMKNIIKYCLAIVFIASALLKLIDFNNTAELFADMLGFTVLFNKFLLATLILFELVIAYWIADGKVNQKNIFKIIVATIAFFILVNIFLSIKGADNCGCFGNEFTNSPTNSLIKNILLMTSLWYLKFSNSNKIKLQSKSNK